MEGGNPKITSEISTSAIVGSTYDASSHPNEIKQEFPLSDPNSHGGFVEHTIAYVSPLIKRINVNFKRLISSAYTGTNLKLEMEDEVKPEVTSEPAFVDPKSDVSHPNEIKNDIPLSEPHSQGGFVNHASGSAYTDTNLKLEIEEEIKPEVASEVSLLAIIDPKTDASHSNKIKREFPLSEPGYVERAVVKYEDTSSIQSFDLQIKSDASDLKCGIKSDNDDIYIKFEPLMSEELDIKNETHIGEKPDYTAAVKGDLGKHMKTPTVKKPFKCNVCDYKAALKGNLRKHMKTHTGEKPFKCYFCDYSCLQKSRLRRHMKTHTGEKPFKCNVCDYRCREKGDLRKHMKIHIGEKPLKCNVCNYRCIWTSRLHDHFKIHTGEKPFKCKVCDYTAALKGTLQRHIKNHNGGNPFTCNVCDYHCMKKGDLGKHMKTHTGKKPLQCIVCGYTCIQKSNLRRHMKTHAGEKRFECNVCGYTCIQKSHLRRHMKTHTGEKPFKCNVCDYRCIQKGDLGKHMKTHTGEKPFICIVCNYRCTTKSNLQRHMRTHTGEKS